MSGKVTLVGAGPGGVELLTIGGANALQQAQVVLYDRLVSPDILQLIPSTAEKINVGKERGHHPMPQEAINALLCEKALEGKEVVRLKGGDSFLFGRGGEELELLKEKNISYKVISGVTSALAVPSYGGIPVTHRGLASSLHIFTGHKKENQPISFRYDSLATLLEEEGTLVFLMSLAHLSDIVKGLLEAGVSHGTTVAVIEQGARPEQRVFRGSLSEIPHIVQEHQVQSPSIFMVGKVCQLDYPWYTKELEAIASKPLFGLHFLVTSPEREEIHREKQENFTKIGDVGRMGALLQEQGAKVTTACRLLYQTVESPLPNWKKGTWLLFTSQRGVDGFFYNLALQHLDTRALGECMVASVGEATANRLGYYGISPDFVPNVHNGYRLAEELYQKVGNADYLLITGKENSGQVQQYFQSQDVSLREYICYQVRFQKEEISPEIPYDGVMFTSGNTVEAFGGFHPQCCQLPAFCIGETTRKQAENLGFSTITAKTTSLEGVLNCVKEYYYDS